MNSVYSKSIKFREGEGFLHGFSTGLVKVKSKFRTAKGGELVSKVNFLLDKEWTENMPIMVWVIDHPEGIFVVDTGENAHVTEPSYFKKEGPILNFINTRSFAFEVNPEDEIGPQLSKLGYEIKDISKVILTHLHLDHFDGLSYFENTPILINKLEWDKPSFALPSLYPEWFEPKEITLESSRNNFFKSSKSLVQSDEIQLIHTPGHTIGHCSVLVKSKSIDFLLAGDVTYDQDQLINNVNAGGHQNFKLAQRTYTEIKRYASKHHLTYLPSHDYQGLERLASDAFLKNN